MKLLIRTHLSAIVLAFCIGALYAGPHVVHSLSQGYQGIVMADSADAVFYLTHINKSYVSPGLVGDSFQYEYRNDRNPFQYFAIEFALGKIGSLFHMPIDVLNMLMEFFFPAVITLLLYALAYVLSRSRLTSFVVAAAMLLGNEIVRPDGILQLKNVLLFQSPFREFLQYSRPIDPQESAIFFFAALLFAWYLFQNPISKWRIALCGIAVGLLAYIYFFFWAFALVLLGVIFLYALITRAWPLAIAACSSGVISILVASPFIFIGLSIVLYGAGGGNGLTMTIPTHQFIFEKMILVPLFLYALIYAWAWWSRARGKLGEWASVFSKKYIFVPLLLIAGLVVTNQQVLTGKAVYPLHFHFMINIPLFLFAMSLLGMELLALAPRPWRIAAVAICVAGLAWFALGVQVSSYKAHFLESLRYQQLVPVYSYLNSVSPNAVLLADPYLSTRLTIYTQDYAYGTSYDPMYQVPYDRLVHDYFVLLALRGVTADSVRSYLYDTTNRNEAGGYLFGGEYYRDTCGSYGCFPDSVLEDLIPQYKAFISHPLLENLKEYKIDYVLVDRAQDAGWKTEGIISGKSSISSGDFELYAIR